MGSVFSVHSCSHCGAPIVGSVFCVYCGFEYEERVTPNPNLISWQGNASLSKEFDGIYIAGIASSESIDKDEDIVKQDGMDFEPFIKHGYIIWNNRTQADCIMGIPLAVENVIYK